jgi:hypothetical protein
MLFLLHVRRARTELPRPPSLCARKQTPSDALQLAGSFGAAVDAYRDYQIREEKEIERLRSLIENI